MTHQIHACPFCGSATAPQLGDNVQLDHLTAMTEAFGYTVFCHAGPVQDGCGASVGYWPSEEEAVVAWNKRSNPWFEAVLDQAAITHMPFHEDNPKKTLDDIIDWHVQVALDPKVSEEQAALHADRERVDFLQRAASRCYSYEDVEIGFTIEDDFESHDVRELIDNGRKVSEAK